MSWENPYELSYGMGVYWDQHPKAEHFATKPRDGIFTDFVDRPFDFDLFFSFFPEFEGSDTYSRPFIGAAAKQAAMFVKPTWCRELDGHDRTYVYFLTVAHMCVLIKQQQAGLIGTGLDKQSQGKMFGIDTMPGVMTSASVGGVSVSKTMQFQPRNFWESWYYQTPYGRTLLVFLEQAVAAGLYYNGEENIANCLRD